MGEKNPGAQVQNSLDASEGYQPGDLSTAGPEIVAAGSGSNKEQHASGGYGVATKILGGLVHKAGAL